MSPGRLYFGVPPRGLMPTNLVRFNMSALMANPAEPPDMPSTAFSQLNVNGSMTPPASEKTMNL